MANFAESPDFLLTGPVIEASGDFIDLAGNDVAISGTLVMGETGPESAPGEFVVG